MFSICPIFFLPGRCRSRSSVRRSAGFFAWRGRRWLAVGLGSLLGVAGVIGAAAQGAPAGADGLWQPSDRLASHPAFAGLVPEGEIAWQPLEAAVFAKAAVDQRLVAGVAASAFGREEAATSLRQALEDEGVEAALANYSCVLISPAWAPLLPQRAVFSAGADLEAAVPGVSCGAAQVLLFNGSGEVAGFQMVGAQDYSPEKLRSLLEVYHQRHTESPEVSGYYSRVARLLRERRLRSGTGEARDAFNAPAVAGSLLGRLPGLVVSEVPAGALESLALAAGGRPGGALNDSLRQRLREGARAALDRAWLAVEENGLLVRVGVAAAPEGSPTALLETQALLLFAERELARQGLGSPQRAERCRALLATCEQHFSRHQPLDSATTQRVNGTWQSGDGWVDLDSLMLMAWAKLTWADLDGAQADAWLADLFARLDAAAGDSDLPPALLPPVPGDPPSLRGTALAGLVCLEAAARVADPESRQAWQERSRRWFAALEKRCADGENGYRPLPVDHPLAVSGVTSFADGRMPATMGLIGRWLGQLDAAGVAAAGTRRGELQRGFQQWYLRRLPREQEFFALRARGLFLPGGVEADGSGATPVAGAAQAVE